MRTTNRRERVRLLLMAEHYRVQLGQAIKRRREELGMTQKDLADATHHREAQTVSRWERGENVPANLDVVAEALRWTLAELVAGVEAPDRRTARKLGLPAETPDLVGTLGTEPSQLDRIERLLIELIERLVAAEVIRAVEQELETGPPPARSKRRKRAA